MDLAEGVGEEDEDEGAVEDHTIEATAVTPEAQAATRTTRLVNPVAMVGAAVRLPLNRRSMPTRRVLEGTMAERTRPSWSCSVA